MGKCLFFNYKKTLWPLTFASQGGGVYVVDCIADLVGCIFSGNSASFGDDIYLFLANVYTYGCPAGSSGTAGAALGTYIESDGTITGEAKSYLCGVCVR